MRGVPSPPSRAAARTSIRCTSTPQPSSSARSCCSSSSRSWRSRSCRGSAARRRCGRRVSCSSRRRCSPATRIRTSSCIGFGLARRSASTWRCLRYRSSCCRSSRASNGSRPASRTHRGGSSLLLAATIGLPYFLLSTTSPLVQAWLARARPGSSPYRLFALSNLASMLALIGYPFMLEPWVPTRMQALGWSVGYVVFVLLCAAAGWSSLRRIQRTESAAAAQRAAPASDAGAVEAPPTVARQLLWATLAGTASLLLLAVSNHITQNIAAVPLLWIVPLSIYLLTFILCFDGRSWYHREMFLAMFAAGASVMGWTLADPKLTHDLELQIGVFCIGLFLACMFCHGELVSLKPAPKYLTRFYLMVSLGGALRLRARRDRRADRPAGRLRARRRPRHRRDASSLAGAPRTRRLRRARRRRAGNDDRLRDMVDQASSTIARSSRAAISTACCACSSTARATPATGAR